MVTKLTVMSITVESGQAVILPSRSVQTLCAVDQPVGDSGGEVLTNLVLLAGQCVSLKGRA